MEKNLKQLMQEFLDETVQYYSEDTNRRCVSKGGYCYYNPRQAGKVGVSQGCAIGRVMSSSQKRYVVNQSVANIEPKYMPKSLINFPKRFLVSMQNLHDLATNWDENGLTERGQDAVATISNMISKGKYES